jgi:peptidoglycan/LPS O-acetylase OafA/YrhL
VNPHQNPGKPSDLPPRHLSYLDGWRGMAIAAVLVGHFLHVPFVNLARLGVELFFVLSGRLMADVLFIKNCALPDFFRRRIARVWPGFVVFILTMGVVFSSSKSLHVGGLDVLAALSFTSNYVGAFGHRCFPLDHIWSLCIEEHSYLFLALAAFVARRKQANAVTICLVASGLCIFSGVFQTLVLHGDYYAVYWRTDTRASSILLACGLFLALHKNKALLSRLHPYTTVWLVMIGFLLNFEIFSDTVKYTLGTACFALAICLIDQAPPLILNLLSQKLLVRLGLWSFSVYLWQEPFNRASYPSNHFLKLVGLAICSLGSFYLVEQPARRFLNTRWKPSPKNVARPAATIAK